MSASIAEADSLPGAKIISLIYWTELKAEDSTYSLAHVGHCELSHPTTENIISAFTVISVYMSPLVETETELPFLRYDGVPDSLEIDVEEDPDVEAPYQGN